MSHYIPDPFNPMCGMSVIYFKNNNCRINKKTLEQLVHLTWVFSTNMLSV